MDFPPPLTPRELNRISLADPDVDKKALLWEIKRLHSLLGRADQLVRSISTPRLGSAQLQILQALREAFADEPILIVSAKDRADMLKRPTKGRYGIDDDDERDFTWR